MAAIPPILQQLGRNQQATRQMIAQIKQAKAMLGAMNGQQINLNSILQQNPQVQQMIGQFGGIDSAIRAVCQQKGIDYQEVADAVNSPY